MRKLRTLTYAQIDCLSTALQRLKDARTLLRRGGASRKLVDSARSLVNRADGAFRHAMRCYDSQRRANPEGYPHV